MSRATFGVSSLLFQSERLAREHLLEVARHGFREFELYAAAAHFEYHHPEPVADLQQWLAGAGLVLGRVHAPVRDAGGARGELLNLASGDAERRAQAVAEAEQALFIARRIAFPTFVVHLGVPTGTAQPGEASRDGARRSLESLQAAAGPLGVSIAVEVIPNELSRPEALVHFVDDLLDVAPIGICLDIGHAHLHGDVIDAIETVSEHVIAVDLHDNRGRADEHLVPFEGSVPWAEVMTSLLKIGYEQPLMFELRAGREPASAALERASRARGRLQRFLA